MSVLLSLTLILIDGMGVPADPLLLFFIELVRRYIRRSIVLLLYWKVRRRNRMWGATPRGRAGLLIGAFALPFSERRQWDIQVNPLICKIRWERSPSFEIRRFRGCITWAELQNFERSSERFFRSFFHFYQC